MRQRALRFRPLPARAEHFPQHTLHLHKVTDDDTGEEYVHIHIISHEYLEEEVDGVRRRLPYAEAKAFLEELLGPPSAP